MKAEAISSGHPTEYKINARHPLAIRRENLSAINEAGIHPQNALLSRNPVSLRSHYKSIAQPA
jgi:hypothetical protein